MTDPIFSKVYVLAPSWNETELVVLTNYQDAGASDPRKRIIVPPGVWMCHLDDETRFVVTPVLVRAGYEIEYASIPSAASFQVQTESEAELYFRLSGTPNTNDNRTSRVGVVLNRMGGSEV